MESLLKNAAQSLLDSIYKNDDKEVIFNYWGKLISIINGYVSCDCMPYYSEVPIAMYQYVMHFSSKNAEENAIRATNTFGVLVNALDYEDDTKKGTILIYISLLLSRYKKFFLNVKYYSIFPITKPKITEHLGERIIDYGYPNRNFDAIKLYIISEVKSKYLSYINKSLLDDFELDCKIFTENFNSESYDKSQMPNGLEVLYDCYNEMIYIGKCPIFVNSPANSEICNKTRGLISKDFSLFTYSYFLHETSGKMMQGGLNARIDVSISDDNMIIKNDGVDNEYLKSNLCLPIKDVKIRKIEQYIEFSFSVHISNFGEVDNIPLFMKIHFDKFKIKTIEFTFTVGNAGYLRELEINGNA
ncbi:MAG: hypothetical protein II947_09075 [Bacteroidaceae bacterium]|nr:hypothetical protein [Bacteroidaceae bacterium]